LQATGTVSAAIHSAIVRRWGIPSVVELTAVIGYYTMVAMTLNAHELPLPAGVDEPLPPHAGLFELAPAQFEGAQG
jgi:4-carboxymuconolactone decarboxylase